jgi:copper oxidase (laccase) domain-containing protein
MARLLFTAKDFGSLADPLYPPSTKKLEDLIGMPVQYMQQSHSNNVSVVSKIGLLQADTDSLISPSKEFALAVRVALCMLPLRQIIVCVTDGSQMSCAAALGGGFHVDIF